MKLKQHKNLTEEKWRKFPFYKQILMIGTELKRADSAYKINNIEEVRECYERALELIFLTIEVLEDKRKLKELLRFKECLQKLYLNPDEKENEKLFEILILMDKEAFNLLNPDK